MKLTTAAIIFSVFLAGCGAADRGLAQLTGSTKVCVDGVTYLQFPSGVTPQYTIDNKLISCK